MVFQNLRIIKHSKGIRDDPKGHLQRTQQKSESDIAYIVKHVIVFSSNVSLVMGRNIAVIRGTPIR